MAACEAKIIADLQGADEWEPCGRQATKTVCYVELCAMASYVAAGMPGSWVRQVGVCDGCLRDLLVGNRDWSNQDDDSEPEWFWVDA